MTGFGKQGSARVRFPRWRSLVVLIGVATGSAWLGVAWLDTAHAQGQGASPEPPTMENAPDAMDAPDAPDAERGPDGLPIPMPVTRPTTNADLDRWMRAAVDRVESPAPGRWQLTLAERPVLVITDERAGRMRIITAVGPAPEDADVLTRLMQANFDTALDARYAVRGDTLWAAYIGPLPTLTRQDLLSGMAQVVNLALNYGTSYSSTGMRFAPPDGEDGPRGRLEPDRSL